MLKQQQVYNLYNAFGHRSLALQGCLVLSLLCPVLKVLDKLEPGNSFVDGIMFETVNTTKRAWERVKGDL